MFKADFHLHTNDDPKDGKFIKHSHTELIDHLSKLHFDIFSITNHDSVSNSKAIQDYANKKSMVFIPGAEFTVDGSHVLVLNPKPFRGKISFEKLYKMKENGSAIIAPHPYYLRSNSLFEKLEEHIKLFDAIEFCHFYTSFFSRNRKAEETAKKHNKPLIANSDAHFLWQVGSNFTRVSCEDKTPESVIEAIKSKKVSIETKPISAFQAVRTVFSMKVHFR